MTEDELWEKRFRELADQSYNTNSFTFTPFLSQDKTALFYRMEKDLSYAGYELSGGIPGAERVVIRFGDAGQYGYEEDFPIVCLIVKPLVPKYAEPLTHRDFLGALMNLGIERELIGDIIVKEDAAYLFCLSRIADYICDHLTRVRHTNVKVRPAQSAPEEAMPTFRREELIVSSERADGLIAKLYRLSRNESASLFSGKKIFVNGRQCENCAYRCKENDTVSVRGYGKFIFCGVERTTQKGRLRVSVDVYC